MSAYSSWAGDAGKVLPASPAVTMTGFVPDIRPWIAGATVSVVPLLQGGGTRLKTLETIALRTPVVSTTQGAEGLDVDPDRHLLTANDLDAFAVAVVALLDQPALRDALADNAYRLVAAHYDLETVIPLFLQLVQEST